MEPGEYPVKWDLPSNYPMIAPEYSAVDSLLVFNDPLFELQLQFIAAPENEVA